MRSRLGRRLGCHARVRARWVARSKPEDEVQHRRAASAASRPPQPPAVDSGRKGPTVAARQDLEEQAGQRPPDREVAGRIVHFASFERALKKNECAAPSYSPSRFSHASGSGALRLLRDGQQRVVSQILRALGNCQLHSLNLQSCRRVDQSSHVRLFRQPRAASATLSAPAARRGRRRGPATPDPARDRIQRRVCGIVRRLPSSALVGRLVFGLAVEQLLRLRRQYHYRVVCARLRAGPQRARFRSKTFCGSSRTAARAARSS